LPLEANPSQIHPPPTFPSPFTKEILKSSYQLLQHLTSTTDPEVSHQNSALSLMHVQTITASVTTLLYKFYVTVCSTPFIGPNI